MTTITIVGVVHMRARRVAGRGRMGVAIAIVRTMSDPRRPRNLEGQHGQEEQQNETLHSGGV
jgi:hypothetical protein